MVSPVKKLQLVEVKKDDIWKAKSESACLLFEKIQAMDSSNEADHAKYLQLRESVYHFDARVFGEKNYALMSLYVGITPAIGHFTGNRAAGFQAGATAAGSAGSILHSLGGWGGSYQQGQAAEASYKLQATQRELSEQDQNMQRALQSENTHKENLRQQERIHAETFRTLAS